MLIPIGSRSRQITAGVLALIVVVLSFSAYLSWKKAEQKSIVLLERFNTLPDFSFVDQDGKTISARDLRGKIWVADFILLRGAGKCPAMSSRYAELDRNFQKSDALRLISFTLDSERDNATSLKKYAQRYEASPRWSFLTGDPQRIYDLAANGFQLAVREPASVTTDSIRSSSFALVDVDGVIRGYYDGASDEAVPKLLTDLGSLLRHGGR